ncbi:MAG: glycosyltransferase family 4 protein [Thermoanaerobaculales bacterium]|nr:glycosyltransferase family 4 protein [Thermoanaerobaculales bacterium]
MNIACDARALVGPHTGVGTWTTQLMGGLARIPGNRILLAASKALDLSESLRETEIDILPPPKFPLPGTVWLHTMLPHALERRSIDVFVASLAILPIRCPVPGIVMVHDLTPRTHPECHTAVNRFCFNGFIKQGLRAATAVVVGSQATEDEVLDFFPWVREKLHRISYGVDEFFSPGEDENERQTTRLRFSEGRPYILHLGTLEPRKGLLTLIEAWEHLHEMNDDHPDLVLAGGDGWGMAPLLDRIARSPLKQRIHRPGYVSREDSRTLLRHAEVFVLASEAEGYGLPLAEAVACGTPCVASDIRPLRESGGAAALFTPPLDGQALAHTIAEALEPHTAEDLRRRASIRASELGWEPVVKAWQDLLLSAKKIG